MDSCVISIVKLKYVINYLYKFINVYYNFFIVYYLMLFFYSFSRNEDSDINRSKLLLNGFIGQATSNKYEDFTDSFWGPRNNIENQTRQHYLARNRYITEQSLRLPYPSVYGTQNISEYFIIYITNVFLLKK